MLQDQVMTLVAFFVGLGHKPMAVFIRVAKGVSSFRSSTLRAILIEVLEEEEDGNFTSYPAKEWWQIWK